MPTTLLLLVMLILCSAAGCGHAPLLSLTHRPGEASNVSITPEVGEYNLYTQGDRAVVCGDVLARGELLGFRPAADGMIQAFAGNTSVVCDDGIQRAGGAIFFVTRAGRPCHEKAARLPLQCALSQTAEVVRRLNRVCASAERRLAGSATPTPAHFQCASGSSGPASCLRKNSLPGRVGIQLEGTHSLGPYWSVTHRLMPCHIAPRSG